MRAALLVPLLVAGCLATEPPAVAPPEAPDVLAWGLDGCAAIIGLVPVEAEGLAERVPEGFRLATPAELGLPPDFRGDATLGLELFTCASGTGLNGTVDALPYGSFFTAVVPPPELAEDVDFHFLKWEVLVPDAPRRELLAMRGVPALDGSVELELVDEVPDAFVAEGTLRLDGAGTLQARASGVLDGPDQVSFVEFTPVDGGFVAWRGVADSSGFRVGTVDFTLEAGTFPADVVGGTTATGYAYVGPVSFSDASIQLPP